MAIELRADERQWLRYQPDEVIGTMRAAEAFAMRVLGASLVRRSAQLGIPTAAAEDMRHIGHILNKLSDARMDYLANPKYDTPLESAVGASSFDVIGRLVAGEAVAPDTLVAATDAILAALKHIDIRTSEAGFLNSTRLESVLARGD